MTKMCSKAICNIEMSFARKHTSVEYASEQRTGERPIRSPMMVRLNSLQLPSSLAAVRSQKSGHRSLEQG